MSPLRFSHTRKRRSEESSSSESDQDFEDVRPVKKRRGCNGDTNLTDALTSKFKDVCQWLSELHIPNFFSQNMSRKIEMENNSTDEVVEEIPNQEIDVIDISDDDDDDDDVSKEIIPLEKEISTGKGLRQNLQKAPLQETPNPLSSSTPFYKTHGRKLSSLSDKPVNGFHGNGKRQTLISNPGVDIEVLLDTRETPVEVSDDELEIVSEISHVKHSKKLTRQPISPIDKHASSSKKYNKVSPQNSILNGSDKKQSSFNKTFTAHEVVRLQEKAQYQLLLDKVIGGGCNYIPAAHKNTKPPPEIEVDLTQDDDEPAGINRFKESVELSLNDFVQKYYKPFKKTTNAANSNPDLVEKVIADTKKPYEDIQIVEIKRAEKTTNNASNGHKKGLYSSAWIEELKMTINAETQQRLKLVTEQEEKLERYRKRRDEKIVEQRLLRGHSVTDEIESEEFPELTARMNEAIDAIFANPVKETVSTVGYEQITAFDIQTLCGLNWLNDSVMHYYLSLIAVRSLTDEYRQRKCPTIHTYNTYFYSALRQKGEAHVLRWTRKVDVFTFDILFVPIHFGLHWALCVINNRYKTIKFYDSMRGTDDGTLKALQSYLVLELQTKKGVENPIPYSLEIIKDIPQQMNGSDCGMFALKYAEYISRNAPFTFSQENMPYFRRRMVYEIITNQLF